MLEAEAPGAEGSAGPGRIFRHIHDLDELVPLAVAARRGWEEAGERFGRPLLDRRGALLVGGPRERYGAVLAAAGIAHALLEPDDLPPLRPSAAWSARGEARAAAADRPARAARGAVGRGRLAVASLLWHAVVERLKRSDVAQPPRRAM